ncbi:hypothetical protein [Dyella sp. GSA-30]|uniref:hypothetical protein n=1 Tax=Dyella sp. GSA-30 TaxID=2994496 RepID=UPI002493797C|nr:hypothetical protein [Dyella sp. GSA-30]BDU21748.1 hypothetical protein DYGSA30_32050 [Dyella sp. GSA-30]
MVSPLLANVLAARRPLFNQRVAEARHRAPQLDMAAFSGFVTDTLDPLCRAIGKVDEQATVAVVEVAFEIGLGLVAQGLAGPAARSPWVDRAWQQLASPMTPLLVQSPADALGTVTNAVVRLCGVPGVRVDAWIADMAALTPRCQKLQELRSVGALCAWRAGMAHLRQAALEQAAAIDPALAAAAMGAPNQSWSDLEARLRADRWWRPIDGIEAQGQTVGGFTGFGGPFATPPVARACTDGFLVQSGERHFLVISDAFGAVVLPATAGEFAGADAGTINVSVTPTGVNVQGREIAVRLPGDAAKAAMGVDSAALFSPWTHTLRVLPVRA